MFDPQSISIWKDISSIPLLDKHVWDELYRPASQETSQDMAHDDGHPGWMKDSRYAGGGTRHEVSKMKGPSSH